MNLITWWLFATHLIIRIDVAGLFAKGPTNRKTVGQSIIDRQSVGQKQEKKIYSIR